MNIYILIRFPRSSPMYGGRKQNGKQKRAHFEKYDTDRSNISTSLLAQMGTDRDLHADIDDVLNVKVPTGRNKKRLPNKVMKAAYL